LDAYLPLDVAAELAHLADPAIGALLTGRGYRLVSFKNVLGLAITGMPEPVAAGITVRRSGDEELESWIDVVVPARFFGVFMSVNPVFAALAGLVVLGQSLGMAGWLAVAAIVTANVVSLGAAGRLAARASA
jgi:hypothetical protein